MSKRKKTKKTKKPDLDIDIDITIDSVDESIDMIYKPQNEETVPSNVKDYNKLVNKLKIDETYTKIKVKAKFDHVRENIVPLQDINLQCDLLQLPKTKAGYQYLLTVMDLWSNEIDARPLKTKVAPVVLEAFKDILEGPHIQGAKKLRTDAGSEFTANVFTKYMPLLMLIFRCSIGF